MHHQQRVSAFFAPVAEDAALRLLAFGAAAQQGGLAVPQRQQGPVVVQQRGGVGALLCHVVGCRIGRQRAVGAAGGKAGVHRVGRPAHGAAQAGVAAQAGAATHAHFFAVVNEGCALAQQVQCGGQLEGAQVAAELVEGSLAGKAVVVGEEGAQAGAGRHAGQAAGVSVGGCQKCGLGSEGKGAPAGVGKGVGGRRAFAHHKAFGIAAHFGGHFAHVAEVLSLVLPGAGAVLKQHADGIEAESIDAAIEPEAQVVAVEVDHRRLAQIPIGHLVPEGRVVRTAAGRAPGVATKNAPASRHAGLPDEPVPEAVGGVEARGAKERVVGGAVVDHVVQHHPNAPGMRLAQQFIHVGQAAVGAFDVAVVHHRIAVVAILAALDGEQPQALDAEALQVVQAADQALEVAHAIAVAVLVAAHKDLHEGAELPVRVQ